MLMPTRKTSPTITDGSTTASPAADPVDEMMVQYVNWREDAAAVSDAYVEWRAAPRAEEAWRFSVYLAALDGEEASAGSYARAVADVACTLHRDLSL
jgi:hypothetical protein